RERIALHAAEADQIGSGRDRLDDVAAAAEGPVDQDLRTSADGIHNLRQYLHGTTAMVELAATMVRHVDPIDAMLDRNPGVFGGGDALEGERDLEAILD